MLCVISTKRIVCSLECLKKHSSPQNQPSGLINLYPGAAAQPNSLGFCQQSSAEPPRTGTRRTTSGTLPPPPAPFYHSHCYYRGCSPAPPRQTLLVRVALRLLMSNHAGLSYTEGTSPGPPLFAPQKTPSRLFTPQRRRQAGPGFTLTIAGDPW